MWQEMLFHLNMNSLKRLSDPQADNLHNNSVIEQEKNI